MAETWLEALSDMMGSGHWQSCLNEFSTEERTAAETDVAKLLTNARPAMTRSTLSSDIAIQPLPSTSQRASTSRSPLHEETTVFHRAAYPGLLPQSPSLLGLLCLRLQHKLAQVGR